MWDLLARRIPGGLRVGEALLVGLLGGGLLHVRLLPLQLGTPPGGVLPVLVEASTSALCLQLFYRMFTSFRKVKHDLPS